MASTTTILWHLLCFSSLQIVGGVLDPTLTLVSQWGQLEDPPAVTSVRCLSGHHPPDKIEFARALNTGQDAHLPLNKKIDERRASKLLHIPPSVDPNRDHQFGAFLCRVSAHDVVTQVLTLKQPSLQNAEVISRGAYVRAHVGQNVTLHMAKTGNGDGKLLWRHRGVKVNRGMDSLDLNIPNVELKDAGFYELFYEGRRKLGRHAIARLILTQCPANKYGPKCDLVCPTCLNGGICHETSGQCLCPPGFGGENCENACGVNKFGPSCSWECDSKENAEGCARFLICLPDPMSCSCAAGFMGFDCTQKCPAGRFGANCQQGCKCSDDDVCDVVTGACPNACREGWQGGTCQIPELERVQGLQLWKTESPSRVRISWSPSSTNRLHSTVSYTIEYRFAKKEGCVNKLIRSSWQLQSTTELEMTLENLQAHSLYEFYIMANSSVGTSKSIGGTFVTDPGVPKGHPTNVTVISVESNSAEFGWDLIDCVDSEGSIEAYETEVWMLPESVRGYKELEDKSSAAWSALENSQVVPTRINSSTTKIRISGLGAYHHYAFRVRGRTSAGSGPWSDGVVFMTEYSMVPSPQLMLVEKSARTLSIGVASMEVPPELIRRIKLRLWAKSLASPVETEVDLDANPDFVVHNYTFHKLRPFTEYFVRAKMAVEAGWGNWSSVLQIVTDETYPSAPSVTLLHASSNHLKLVLHPPTVPNGVIVKYKIRVAGTRSSGVTPVIPVVPVPSGSGDLNYTVKDLVPASWYQINVQAATGVGWGNWSESFDAWTNEGVPEAPSSLRLVACNGTSLHVKWTQPSKAYGKVTGYELFCNPRSSLNSSIAISQLKNQSFRLDEKSQEFVISHLEPLTKYSVEIRAENVKFQGHRTSKIFMTGIPTPISLECFPDSATETKIPLLVSTLNLPSDFLTFYQVIIENGDKDVVFDETRLNDYESALASGLDYYVALQVDGTQITPYGLLVYAGDDRNYGGYWNAPLTPEKFYRFRLRVVAFDGQMNFSSYSLKSAIASTTAVQPVAQRAGGHCLIYDPQCFWFPFSVVGFSICIIWIALSIIAFKYCLNKKPVQKQIPTEKEPGSCTSFTWSVAVKK